MHMHVKCVIMKGRSNVLAMAIYERTASRCSESRGVLSQLRGHSRGGEQPHTITRVLICIDDRPLGVPSKALHVPAHRLWCGQGVSSGVSRSCAEAARYVLAKPNSSSLMAAATCRLTLSSKRCPARPYDKMCHNLVSICSAGGGGATRPSSSHILAT
jgi:hypothetical protein